MPIYHRDKYGISTDLLKKEACIPDYLITALCAEKRIPEQTWWWLMRVLQRNILPIEEQQALHVVLTAIKGDTLLTKLEVYLRDSGSSAFDILKETQNLTEPSRHHDIPGLIQGLNSATRAALGHAAGWIVDRQHSADPEPPSLDPRRWVAAGGQRGRPLPGAITTSQSTLRAIASRSP